MSRRKASRLDKIRWLMAYSYDFLMIAAFLGIAQLVVMTGEGYPLALAVAGSVLCLILFVLGTRPFRIMMAGRRRPTLLLTVSGVIALALSATAVFVAAPIWLAMLTPFVRKRTAILASAGVVAASGAAMALLAPDYALQAMLVVLMLVVFFVGATIANQALWKVALEAHDGEEAKARLAVSEERLRLAKDLNALLGQSLAEISATSLVAAENPDREAARQEMFEVRDRARSSLKQVRETVQNYRALDLDETLSSVRAVLEAADVVCIVRASTADLSPQSRTLLATAVREGATTILQQGTVKRCVITIEGGVLEMSNDGSTWQGLEALAARVSAAGGTVSAEPGLFRATVPA
ncbi:MAG: hypothetical protein HOV86_10385 [Thermoactinospora sp.]|nr:hypothetical protein [Thermoactinospora sp.]